jgi:hypothetical protein
MHAEFSRRQCPHPDYDDDVSEGDNLQPMLSENYFLLFKVM